MNIALRSPTQAAASGMASPALVTSLLALAGSLLLAIWAFFMPVDSHSGLIRFPEALALTLAATGLVATVIGGRGGYWRALCWAGGLGLIVMGVARLQNWLRLGAPGMIHDPSTFAPILFTTTALAGLALVLLDRPGRRMPPVQPLALAALTLVFFSAASDWFRLGSAPLPEVAAAFFLQTDAVLGLILIALLLHSSGGLQSTLTGGTPGGYITRRLLPVAVFVPLIMGWLRFAAERAGFFGTEVGLGLFTTLNTVVIVAVLVFIAARLNAEHDRRASAEGALEKLNRDLELRIAERTASLDSTIEELKAFTYSVSHDLRAPLRSIDGFTRLLNERHAEDLSEEGRDYLRRVTAAAGRMGGLIDDLLDLSRVSRWELRPVSVDLSGLAEDVVAELRSGEPERQVDVRIQPGMVAHGDPTLLRIVIANLLGNAWKFTAHTEAPEIEFGMEDEVGRVFRVKDNGAGFDMQYAARLFEPFQRMHSEHDFPGYGIGLATVNRIIKRHFGRIWADSTLGKGTVFFFTLPAEGKIS